MYAESEIPAPTRVPLRVSGLLRRIPADVLILLPFLALWIAGLLAGLPLNLPDRNGLRFIGQHYVNPLAMLVVIQLAAVGLGKLRGAEAAATLRLLPTLLVATVLHFHFKAWMPLINPHLFDAALYHIDQSLAPVVNAYRAGRDLAAPLFGGGADLAYHLVFVVLFYISILAHAILDTPQNQRRLILGLALVLLLGGVSYWIMPAVGPFVFGVGSNPVAHEAQLRMLAGFERVRRSGMLPQGYFAAPPAAMPSLHIAHPVVMILCAAACRRTRWLLGVYLPLFGFILCESVTSGWHYLADGPVGALLGIACFLLADRLATSSAPLPSEAAVRRGE